MVVSISQSFEAEIVKRKTQFGDRNDEKYLYLWKTGISEIAH